MRSLRLHGKGDLRLHQEQRPEPRAGETLVRVTAVGICGSDLHWWDDAGIGDAVITRPLVLGHEAAGVIEAGPRRGTRVAIDPAISCGRCRPCLDGHRNLCPNVRFAGHGDQDGAMRELLAWPSDLLHPLPDSVTDTDGALLEPLGVAIHALDLGHVRIGARVAVVGCGPIGLLLVAVLRTAGASHIAAFEPLPHRREAALRYGADVCLRPDILPGDLRELVGEGAETVFEMAGTADAVTLSMAAARPGGRVVLGGIPSDDRISFEASTARRKGLTIAMVRRMNNTYGRAIALAAAGSFSLAPLVTDRFGLASAGPAFGIAAKRKGLKVVIEPAA